MAESKVEYWLTADGLTLLTAWARDGLTLEQIAHNMGIHIGTLCKYKKQHNEINEALKKGKEVADIEVENAMFKAAIGYTKTVKKPIKVREEKTVQGKGKVVQEHIEYVDEEIYIPPNITAGIYWLNNRKPNEWRNKHRAEIAKINAETDYTKARTAEIQSGGVNTDIEDLTPLANMLNDTDTDD